MPWGIVIRFFLGAAAGSFLGVIADRYDPAQPLFSRRALGGRSRCAACSTTLRWYELVPAVSFIVQRGRCRSCGVPIPWRVLLIEIICGAILAAVPATAAPVPLAALWTAAFLLLALVSWIDSRLTIIPDEANAALVVLGVLRAAKGGAASASFIGSYALLFGTVPSAWAAAVFGAVAGAAFFGVVVFATRGRGMGMGDVKLAAALGFLFGWPDILFLSAFSFMIGSIIGVIVIVSGRKTLKSSVPFGPFLALGSATLFFFGADIVRWYFELFP